MDEKKNKDRKKRTQRRQTQRNAKDEQIFSGASILGVE